MFTKKFLTAVITAGVVLALPISLFLLGCEGSRESRLEEKLEEDLPSIANAITAYLDDNLLTPNFGGKRHIRHIK